VRALVVVATLLSAGLLFVASGCGNSPAGEPKAASEAKGSPAEPKAKPARRAYPVRVQKVESRAVHYELKALGNIEAQDVYQIDARVPGTLYDVNFREGDEVKADQVLCRIAPEAYRQSMLKTKAMYDQAVAQHANFKRKSANDIQRTRIKLDEAKMEFARRRDVRKAGAISDEEIQLYQSREELAALELKDATEAADTELKVLAATIEQRQAELKIAEEDVRKSIVIPPISGVIEKRFVTTGMFASSGMPLAIIVDTRMLKVVFKLSERESSTVKVGDKIAFSVPAWPTEEFTAELYFIGQKLETDARVVLCYGRVVERKEKLKPGYFASVKISTESKPNALVVPVTAIQPTERGFMAYLADGEKAVQRPVKLGLNVSEDEVEVISGLKAGDILVVEGANALSQGAPIKVMEQRGNAPEKPAVGAVKTKEVSAQ
jgi:membrane fusion protein, multidrug efflux system